MPIAFIRNSCLRLFKGHYPICSGISKGDSHPGFISDIADTVTPIESWPFSMNAFSLHRSLGARNLIRFRLISRHRKSAIVPGKLCYQNSISFCLFLTKKLISGRFYSEFEFQSGRIELIELISPRSRFIVFSRLLF